jgi:hypothetical protein
MRRSRRVGVSAHPKNLVIKLDKDADTFDCVKYQSCTKSISSCNKSCESYKPYATSRNVVKDICK